MAAYAALPPIREWPHVCQGARPLLFAGGGKMIQNPSSKDRICNDTYFFTD